MTNSDSHELTVLLRAWSEGDSQALEKLTPRVYGELHRLARLYMAQEKPGHPLQATALINEAFVRLIEWRDVKWQSRTHFIAMAATLMRRVLVDIARSRKQRKRGGGAELTTIEEETLVFQPAKSDALLALDAALSRLEAFDQRKSRVVELRFFGGLTVEETAGVLQISERTVQREWDLARAWLRREVQDQK